MPDKVSHQILIDCIRARLATGDRTFGRSSTKSLLQRLVRLQEKAEQMARRRLENLESLELQGGA